MDGSEQRQHSDTQSEHNRGETGADAERRKAIRELSGPAAFGPTDEPVVDEKRRSGGDKAGQEREMKEGFEARALTCNERERQLRDRDGEGDRDEPANESHER